MKLPCTTASQSLIASKTHYPTPLDGIGITTQSILPEVKVNWQKKVYSCQKYEYDEAPEVVHCAWRDVDNKTLMPETSGLYVITLCDDKNECEPIYAGETRNLRNRFDNRSDVLGNFRFGEDQLSDYEVYIGTGADLDDDSNRKEAEKWLIGTLVKGYNQMNNRKDRYFDPSSATVDVVNQTTADELPYFLT